ncbi:hypothetical protein G6F68_017696 [Rhizopus microsporus]|nr:hypothetical protein G6F68_017696 [Rhizopus microsporus]
MTPVFAQMQRDQVGAGILRAQRGGHRVRIRLLSLSSRRNFGRFFRGFFPAAAQRLVELHAVDQRGQTGLHQRQLGIEEIHLRGLHLQIAVDTIAARRTWLRPPARPTLPGTPAGWTVRTAPPRYCRAPSPGSGLRGCCRPQTAAS